MNQYEYNGDIVVIGYPISGTISPSAEERYYTEPTGVSQIARQAGARFQQVTVGSLRYILQKAIEELEECANGREWEVELTVDIGVGPEPAHVAGKLAITVRGKTKR